MSRPPFFVNIAFKEHARKKRSHFTGGYKPLAVAKNLQG
jgi:hypothetical protein